MPDTIPTTWDYRRSITASKKVLVFEPYYGPRQTRSFGSNSAIHSWEIGNDDSSYTEFIQQKTFWNAHFPGISVYLYDPVLNEYMTVEIDSDFAQSYSPGDSYAWSYRLKQVYPYSVVSGMPPP